MVDRITVWMEGSRCCDMAGNWDTVRRSAIQVFSDGRLERC
jgi:hypothetical protein